MNKREFTFGSCTKAPPLLFGGISPVVAYLRHSMIVVFPAPLCPTMIVRGALNSITFCEVGENDRIPTIFNFSILDIEGGWSLVAERMERKEVPEKGNFTQSILI